MKHFTFILLAFFSLLTALSGQAQEATDASLWTYYLAYQDAEQVASAGNGVVYARFNGNLLRYDAADQSVSEIDRRTGLSDKGIAYMGYSPTQHCLVLAYKSNNIDLLFDNGTTVNIPQLKHFTDYDITPTSLNVSADWALLSTTEGIVAIDLKRREVKAYYRFMRSVRDATVVGEQMLAALEGEAVSCRLEGNPYSLASWSQVAPFTVSQFVSSGGGAYLLAPIASGQDASVVGVHFIRPDGQGGFTRSHITSTYMDRGTATPQGAQFVGSWGVHFASADAPEQLTSISMGHYLTDVTRDADGTFWLADNGKLRHCRLSATGDALDDTGNTFGGFGARRDLAYTMHYEGNRLLVAGGQHFLGLSPTAMMLDEEGKWHFFQESGDNVVLNPKVTLTDFNDIAQDPADPTHHFVGFFGGVAEYKDFQFVKHYGSANSGLEFEQSSGLERPKYTMVGGLNFDAEGNLWMLNSQTANAVKVLKKDGTWAAIAVDGLNKGSTQVQHLLFDADGRVWITSRRQTSTMSGLACLDYGGTIDDTSDDTSLLRYSVTNEDGATCDIKNVYDICLDRSNQLWIGCEKGVFVVQRPDQWFSSSFSIYQPKVPRNDGTNYADYLLTGIGVTAIAVDGANRKWLGTEGSGIYLVNDDGSEVISHFTTENSPILSDNIFALAIHPATGELMVGTDEGLCSYATGVTRAADHLVKSEVKVFPNPVRPDYHGRITISGLTDGAEVKIVSSAGQLVTRGNATGGAFLWDGCNARGQRVAAGVYFILLATADGSTAVASKVVVI